MSESEFKQTRLDGDDPHDEEAKQATLGASDSFEFEGVKVISRGQMTLPADERDDYDLSQGDYVDIELLHDGEVISIGDRKIGNSGRVTIPGPTRERHGISEGDRVNGHVYLD